MEHHNQHFPLLHLSGWAIWHRNKAIPILDEVIAQIIVAPTDTVGWVEENLCAVWKHLFQLLRPV